MYETQMIGDLRRAAAKISQLQLVTLTSLLITVHSACTLAAPAPLSQSEFALLASESITTTEDFESFSAGILTSPVTLSNSTYVVSGPRIFENFGQLTTKAMFDDLNFGDERVFDSFLPNTTMFSSKVQPVQSAAFTQVLRVTVIGNSGVYSAQNAFGNFGSFFAFHDPAGLTRVSFQNLGQSQGSTVVRTNVGIDDVTTGRPVPEPCSTVLSIAAFALFLDSRTTSRQQRYLK